MLLLEGQFVVGAVALFQSALTHSGERAPRVVCADYRQRVGDPRRSALCRQRIAGFQRGVRQCFLESAFKPRFFVSVPCCRHVPRRQPSCRAALAELVGAFVAHCSVQCVASLPRICCCSEECCAALVCVLQLGVCRVVLGSFLEHLVCVVGDFAQRVLHAPAAEPVVRAVYAVGFHSCVEVYYVVFCVDIVITGRCAEVPCRHLVGSLVIDASVGQNAYGKGVDVVRVLVKERVVLANG